MEARGESPLEVEVPPLEKGSYVVFVRPVAGAGPVDVEASWTFHADG